MAARPPEPHGIALDREGRADRGDALRPQPGQATEEGLGDVLGAAEPQRRQSRDRVGDVLAYDLVEQQVRDDVASPPGGAGGGGQRLAHGARGYAAVPGGGAPTGATAG